MSSLSIAGAGAAALGRKLITYTKRQILPFCSPIYVLNPVCVVYDIIDEEDEHDVINEEEEEEEHEVIDDLDTR